MPRCCHSHWCQWLRLAWLLPRALARDFPSEVDQLLLSVAANHAAAAFQNARLRHELDAKVAELGQARNELERKVSERTADLQRSEAYLAEAQRLTHTGSWAFNIARERCVTGPRKISACMASIRREGYFRTSKNVFQRIHPEDRAQSASKSCRRPCARKDYEAHFRIVATRRYDRNTSTG